MESEHLSLKWGTLKSCQLNTEASRSIAQKYLDLGSSLSAMQQQDTPEQKQLLCDLIDVVNCEKIYLEWDGVYVSKEEAKNYILNY